MEKFKYNKIFSSYDEYGYLNLFFFNKNESTAIEFDGLHFYRKKDVIDIPIVYKEFTYRNMMRGEMCMVEKIRQSEDISFIKMVNGDVFQIYFMASDEQLKQQIAVFSEEHRQIMTPLGINSYDAVLKRFDEAEDVDI